MKFVRRVITALLAITLIILFIKSPESMEVSKDAIMISILLCLIGIKIK